MISPDVTYVLILIAEREVALHYEYKHGMQHALDDEQRVAFGKLAIEHGRTAQLFATLAHNRHFANEKKPPDAATT